MSFRPFNPNFLRAALMGLLCLAFAGAARAGEGARSIEVVPFHNTSMDTNFDRPSSDDSQTFKVWKPMAPNSLAPPSPSVRLTPLPHPQQSLSKQEQQLLDRRRNWVFMTPEDYATTDPKTGKSLVGADNKDDDDMTAMERYYRRLEQSSRPATTNDFGRMNPERMSAATNFFNNTARNTDPALFGQTPFSSSAETGVFQPITADSSANVFGNNNSATVQSPEESRIQAAQKTHMENFKQLWDIDQATSAATPVAAPTTSLLDSAPIFGASTPGLPSPFKPNLPSASSSPGIPAKPMTPVSQPSPPRYTPPPHSDFAPTQRPF